MNATLRTALKSALFGMILVPLACTDAGIPTAPSAAVPTGPSTLQVPNLPTAVQVSELPALAVHVEWAHDGANGVTGFQVERRLASEVSWSPASGALAASARSYDDGSYRLDRVNPFIYRVKACNADGCVSSAESSEISTTPLGAPANLVVSASTASSATITWNDNSTQETKFLIFVHSADNAFAGYYSVGADVTTFTMTGLGAGQTYYFRVWAVSDAYPTTSPEYRASMPTNEAPAASPTVVTNAATAVGGTTATVGGTITPNSSATSAWIQYGTDPALAGATSTAPRDAGAGTVPFTFTQALTGLTSGTTYYYRAVGQSLAGVSNGSILSVRPGAPDAPTAVTTSELPGLAVDIQWAHDGANNVTGFQITRRGATLGSGVAVATLPASARSYQDGAYGLDKANTFTYSVAACNPAGCSAGADASPLTTTPLAAPTNLTASSVTANSTTVTWTDNSAQETKFQIYVHNASNSFAGSYTVAANATTFTMTGLGTGQTYYFRVWAVSDTYPKAVEGQRASLPSNEVSAVPGNGVGATPSVTTNAASPVIHTGVTSTGGTLNGTVTPNGLATTAWIEYGTSPTLAGATATATSDAGAGTTPFTFSREITGLTTGTTYYYRAVGQNSAGRTDGAILSFRPGRPDGPTSTQTSELPDLGVQVQWAHDGANNVTGFQITRRGATFASGVAVASLPASARSYQDGAYSLDKANPFTYSVVACNQVGCSAGTDASPLTTTQLAAPTNLTASSVTANSATVTWTDNSTQETKFQIYVHNASNSFAGTYTVAANATTFTMAGLGTGQTYYFRVWAASDAYPISSPGQRTSLSTPEIAVVPGNTAGGIPSATTNAASSVTNTGATLNGTVTPNGLATSAWFEYGTSSTLAGATATTARDAGAGTVPFSFTQAITGLTPKTVYYYRAVSQNSAGRTNGAILSFRPGPPDGPTSTQTSELPDLGVQVQWAHDGANNVTGFQITRRGATLGSGVAVATLPASARSYQDGAYGLDKANTFTYSVAACNPAGCSAGADASPLTTTPLAAPTNLTASSVTANSATVTWADNSTQETKFQIYVHSVDNSFAGTYTVGANATSFTMAGLATGQTYYFQVWAVSDAYPTSAAGQRASFGSNQLTVVPQ